MHLTDVAFFISSSIPMGVNQTHDLGLASATFRTTLVSYTVAMHPTEQNGDFENCAHVFRYTICIHMLFLYYVT